MRSRKQNVLAIEPDDTGYLVLPNPNGKLLRKQPELASLACNVSNQRWAEEALVESEERYRIVTETAIDAIVTIDQDGEILFVNRSAERIFGYAVEEMLGCCLTLLAPGYSLNQDGASRQPQEVTGRHKDGHQIPLEVAFGEFTQGSQTLATGVLRDISRRKRAEDARQRAEEDLRRANG